MKASTVRIAEVNATAMERYKEMRAALLDAPGADRALGEIVVTTQLALLGHEVAFKLHAIRLFEAQVSRERLESAVLAGLGVTFVVPQAARALDWIEQAHEQYTAGSSR